MRLGFLGGASGIGASCVLVELEGLRVVVDCGIRQSRGETLPDLRTLQEALGGRAPDAVVLTHAHLDHSGALPVLLRTWPGVPLLTTPATASLLRILLLDALKVMECDRDEELPLYARAEVERTLAAVRPVLFDDPVTVGGGRVVLLPAGHILGAAAAIVEAGRRSVLVSGDLSMADQQTVPGMPVPRLRPDVLVVESTYGDQLHASRAAEERRLAARIAEAVRTGGHVLVPAFAVGRAQEVLLVLKDAMGRGEIPEFPVWADGMVRAVCDAYRHHPELLVRPLRHRARQGGDLFFATGSSLARVDRAADRARIIAGPPCCVVASSGMLAGGASPVYARAWAPDPRTLIAITGYQDEEAPGRAVADLADGSRREIALPGGPVQVSCRVERYHLSAHADADEIVGLASRLAPRAVYVVHGDPGAREALAARLDDVVPAEVLLPADGDLVEPRTRAPRARERFWQGAGIGEGRPVDAAALEALRDLFLRAGRRLLTAERLAQAWFGEAAGPEQFAALREALAAPQAAFSPDPSRPYRFRPRPEQTGPARVAEVRDLAERLLPPETGLYKRSAHQDEHRLVLRFTFPDVQGPAAAEALQTLRDRTGWTVEVHPQPHQGRLVEAARAVLPDPAAAVGQPSLMLDDRCVLVGVHPLPEDAAARAERFLAETGWRLELRAEASAEAAAPAPAAAGILGPQEARPHVREVFDGLPPEHAPHKVSYPGDAIVLHFVHPGVGGLHEARLAALAEATGRAVSVHPHAHQQRLVELVAARLPDDWTLTRPPVWVPPDQVVRVGVWDRPPAEELARVRADLREWLGCELEVLEDG